MVRKQYSKSDIKQFILQFPNSSDFLTKKSSVFEDSGILFIDNVPSFFKSNSSWVPTLHLILKFPNLLPTVTVDKGAIRFVVNGADIMRPGITTCQEFEKNSFVVIVDENFSKPLAIGKALFSSVDLIACGDGKVVLNLHRVGDEVWQIS